MFRAQVFLYSMTLTFSAEITFSFCLTAYIEESHNMYTEYQGKVRYRTELFKQAFTFYKMEHLSVHFKFITLMREITLISLLPRALYKHSH